MNKQYDELKKIKKFFFEESFNQKISHLPSCLSCFEILYVLYKNIVNISNDNKDKINRDRVILSKEHAKWGQLCILTQLGLLDKNCLSNFKGNGSILGQDIYNLVGSPEIAAVDYAVSSLGHGLGVGAGIAYGNRGGNVYVILGDGELQEGSIWEAFLFIAQHDLKNIIIIIDANNYQIDDFTKNIINTTKMSPNAIKALGFDVFYCDGHNLEELDKVFKAPHNKPKCIIAKTIKGKEMLFMQEKYGSAIYHWSVLKEDEYTKIMKGLL